MKLWIKLTAISAAIIIVVLGVCLIAFNGIQENTLKRIDEENVRESLSLLCRNVTLVVNTDTSKIQKITLRSIVSYYYSTYAHFLKRHNTYYSLSQDGQYLFNNIPIVPNDVYFDTEIPSLTTVENGMAQIPIVQLSTEKGSFLIGACFFTISNQNFTAIMGLDISETQRRISQLRWISVFIVFFACICIAFLTAVIMHFTLRPIQKMTKIATQIAGGEYFRRTELKTKDEIGQLSLAFDQMAAAIEEKISSLDDQLHRRQLLLGALGHELKTPMMSIIGYADSLLHMPLSEEQRIACAQKILAAGKHTEALSQKLMELINLTEQGQIDKRVFPANRLAEKLKDFYGSKVDIHCQSFGLYGDETLLLSMMRNLIDNAIRVSAIGERVNVDIYHKGKTAYISVSDKGCGIPPAYVDLVTEPFFKVDAARSRISGGVGLGLTICKLIAEHHGGSISIESKPGQGTRVTASILHLDDISSTT